jgi:hypothetical protein
MYIKGRLALTDLFFVARLMVAIAFFFIPFAFWKLDFISTNDGFKFSDDFRRNEVKAAWPLNFIPLPPFSWISPVSISSLVN